MLIVFLLGSVFLESLVKVQSYKMNVDIVNSIQGIEGQLTFFKRLGVNYSIRLFCTVYIKLIMQRLGTKNFTF